MATTPGGTTSCNDIDPATTGPQECEQNCGACSVEGSNTCAVGATCENGACQCPDTEDGTPQEVVTVGEDKECQPKCDSGFARDPTTGACVVLIGCGGGTWQTTHQSGATCIGQTQQSDNQCGNDGNICKACDSDPTKPHCSATGTCVQCNVAGQCPTAPEHGTAICTATNQCDFTCDTANGFVKQGNACVCPTGTTEVAGKCEVNCQGNVASCGTAGSCQICPALANAQPTCEGGTTCGFTCNAGFHKENNQCVADAPTCTNAQCTDPTKPVCSSGTCVACTSNAQCSAKDPAKPVCNTNTGACKAACTTCMSGGSCVTTQSNAQCGKNGNASVNCALTDKPVCDANSGTCKK